MWQEGGPVAGWNPFLESPAGSIYRFEARRDQTKRFPVRLTATNELTNRVRAFRRTSAASHASSAIGLKAILNPGCVFGTLRTVQCVHNQP